MGPQLAPYGQDVRGVTHQAALYCICRVRVDRRYLLTPRQLQDFLSIAWRNETQDVPDDERTGSSLGDSREGRIEVAFFDRRDEDISSQHMCCCKDVTL